ncbi:penicillin-binding protein 1A [Rhizobacter sp. LjRoot28]|jgi:penicillin-binding protein 1A|uniref:penicillin-binding protein 1A n=1 Tax=Rhizobacter sp. LjRoot28 TaxID=3342309 RepID=UPI003ED03669
MSESTRATQNNATSSPGPKVSGGPRWLRWAGRVALWCAGTVAAGTFAVLLLAGVALAVAYPHLPQISGLVDYRPKLPMRIYSADDVLLGEFGEERRSFTPIGQVPKIMKDAVLAIEDARFYEHSGVDYKGVLRAGLAHLGDARSQGASTITMQVARNFYLSTEKTFTRKIYEVLLALKIETQLTKDQILEVYMNQIYLGQRAYGFAAASEIYFGKPLQSLTIAEAAMLAGLPKAPSNYNPVNNPRRATIRQLYIIDRMLENGFITPEQHQEARGQRLTYRAPSEVAVHAEYVAEAARQMLYAQYGEDAYSRGLNVHLTIRAAEQNIAYRALRKGILEYERRQFYRGPEAYIDLPANARDLDARVAEALVDHPDNDELRSGVALEVSPRKVVAMLQNGETVTVTGEGLKPVASGLSEKAGPKIRIRPGAVIRVVKGAKGDWSVTQLPEVEGAFVALDPRTGAIRAMVGGFDYAKNKFNHVTQAWRQPGSSFKPFIYSASLEKGFTPATVINDAPLFFNAGTTGSQPWEPKNYDGTFDGPMSMRRGLAKSKNMISIRILQSIEPAFAQDWITRFGFDADKHPPYLTMALGAGSVTPLQMATGYGVFANGGHRLDPFLISKVTDAKGKLLTEARSQALDDNNRAIDARNAFVMTSLLQEVTRSGTAARAQGTLKRPDIYGKTGTTNDSLDAWFVGYQRNVVAAVWIGYDTPRKLGARETGGGLALPVWIDFMVPTLKGVPVEEPSAPSGLVNLGGEWYYEEYTHGAGISSLGLDDKLPVAPSEEEKKGILDLFKN